MVLQVNNVFETHNCMLLLAVIYDTKLNCFLFCQYLTFVLQHINNLLPSLNIPS